MITVPPAPSAPPPALPPELFRTLRWPLLGAAWAFFCLGGLLVLARHAANDVLVRPRYKLLRGESEVQARASRRLSAALQETNEWLAACQAQAASEAAVAAPAVAAPAVAAPAAAAPAVAATPPELKA